MEAGIKLAAIPDADYPEYRREVIFNAYKWDPQVGDHNTIAKHVVLMEPETARRLEQWAEQLSAETMLMEETLKGAPAVARGLGLPRKIARALEKASGYQREKHVRLMRFDFHPAREGWVVSEVNSDVPGGLAEASVLPAIARRWHPSFAPRGNTADALLAAFQKRIRPGGAVAFVHATSYSDDRQVMQFLGDHFEAAGLRALYAAPDHIAWDNRRAVGADGIVRFFPLEWLANLPRKAGWTGYFDCETPSCNPPVSMFTQSKRLPLVWDRLGIEIPAWRRLLPETADPKIFERRAENPRDLGGWILKPALGRVGEGISIAGTLPEKEMRMIEKAAKKNPLDWVAQRMFHSQPLAAENGEAFHACVGAFTVDGKSAGFYARISPHPRIDANARDIPVLVRNEEKP